MLVICFIRYKNNTVEKWVLLAFILFEHIQIVLFLESSLNSIGWQLDILYHSFWMLNMCLWQIEAVDRLLEKQPEMTEVWNKWSWELKIDLLNAPFSYIDVICQNTMSVCLFVSPSKFYHELSFAALDKRIRRQFLFSLEWEIFLYFKMHDLCVWKNKKYPTDPFYSEQSLPFFLSLMWWFSLEVNDIASG